MKHVFVVGSQRSGTALMGQIIGAHPLAFLADEHDGVYDWANALFCKSKEAYPKAAFKKCCYSAMAKYLTPGTRFCEDGVPRPSIECAAIQSPNLTYRYAELSSALPNTNIIYMYRDIRDIVSSMMALGNVHMLENQSRYILSSEDLLRTYPSEVSMLRQESNTANYHIKLALVAKIKMSLSTRFREHGFNVIDVRYEDLVSQRQEVISSILERLELPFDEGCLRHNELLGGFGPGRTPRDRAIDDKSKGKWKEYLTEKEANEVWDVAGDLMISLGYVA